MSNKEQQIDNERVWWERYSHIVNKVWDYDSQLFEMIRRPYLERMEAFLFKPEGRIVDYGCGAAWASLPLAVRGMELIGIDLAQSQLDQAAEMAEQMGAKKYRFVCSEHFAVDEPVDSVLLHSVVHHLPAELAQKLLLDIDRVLKPGGRLFIYEPLGVERYQPIVRLAERGVNASVTLLGHLANRFGWVDSDIAQAQQEGWTMQSPEEEPLPLSTHRQIMPASMEITHVSYWHCCMVHYANFCMTLNPKPRSFFNKLLPLYQGADRLLLHPRFNPHLHSWPMASLEIIKRG